MHSDRNTLATKQQESLGRTENIVLVVLIQFIVRLLNVIMRIPCVMSGGIRIRMRRTVRELDAGHDHNDRHKHSQNSFPVTFVHEKTSFVFGAQVTLNRRQSKPLHALCDLPSLHRHDVPNIITSYSIIIVHFTIENQGYLSFFCILSDFRNFFRNSINMFMIPLLFAIKSHVSPCLFHKIRLRARLSPGSRCYHYSENV